MKRVLVTTALEDTWPKNPKEPVLFLGEWCRIYSRKDRWSNMNASVASYHWNDRKKLHKDYLYLSHIYEKLLRKLSTKLNKMHKVNHPNRYWRIIIGPWLGYFTAIVFDRWFMIKKELKKKKIYKIITTNLPHKEYAASCFSEFESHISDDQWNEKVYIDILKLLKTPTLKIITSKNEGLSKNKWNHSCNSLNFLIKKASNKLFSLLSGSSCHLLTNSYLRPQERLKVFFNLKQFPSFWFFCSKTKYKLNKRLRAKTKIKIKDTDPFIKILSSLIIKYIPRIYFEGYKKSLKTINELALPTRPSSIFTSGSQFGNDIFKIYTAEKVIRGSNYIIGQHGGSYGIAKWSFAENHQLDTADTFFSWGWLKRNNNKIIPIGNFKEAGRKFLFKKRKHAVIVSMTVPRFSYHMYSVPVGAGQWHGYFLNQVNFVKYLTDDIKKSLLIRLNPQDFNQDQAKRWQDIYPSIRLDFGAVEIFELFKKAKIVISTYNATNYLESLFHNIPTLIFWDPRFWEIRQEALPYFNFLKKVKIFHTTAKSAAMHLNENWKNLDEWWYKNNVQDARQEFLNKFSKKEPNISYLITQALLEKKLR